MSGRPTYLYKYLPLDGSAKEPAFRDRTLRDRARSVIMDNRLWFSRTFDFNDPFDCQPTFVVSQPSPAEQKAFEGLLLKRLGPMSRQQLRAKVRQVRTPAFLRQLAKGAAASAQAMGVLCLSARPDHMLMWAHYATSHTGICLRFRADTAPFVVADRVQYAEQRPATDAIADLNNADSLVRKGIFTKASCWSYEQEWRVCSHPGSPVANGPGLVPFDSKALDGIILGARISAADAAEVAQWVAGRRPAVRLMQARPNDRHFRIDIGPFVPGRTG